MTRAGPAETESLRIDLWLWYARVCKSRSLATRLCQSGKVRLNRQPVHKAHAAVRPGDVLTFPQGRIIRVVRVTALGGRRGPATEARTLYDDLEPPRQVPGSAARDGGPRPGGPRPTKAERRALDRLRGGP